MKKKEILRLLSLIQFIGSSHIKDYKDKELFNKYILQVSDLIYPDYN